MCNCRSALISKLIVTSRAETKALIGGGGVYSYIRVLPDEFLLKSVVITVDFKRNSSGKTRLYEYATPPPPINALVSALVTRIDSRCRFLTYVKGVIHRRLGFLFPIVQLPFAMIGTVSIF